MTRHAVLAAPLFLVFLLAGRTAGAGAPLTPAVAARCADLGPEIEVAADLAGLPVGLVAAVLAVESGCEAVEGRLGDVAGTGQIRWSTWGPLLAAEGWDEGDLLCPVWGTLAAGRVLGAIRERWGLPAWQVLCAYSDGSAALRYRRDCIYSREVERVAQRLGVRARTGEAR